jgi:hypothetical protein
MELALEGLEEGLESVKKCGCQLCLMIIAKEAKFCDKK